MTMTAQDYIKKFKADSMPAAKKRVPVKKQLAAQKDAIRAEVIAEMRDKQRSLPKEWQAGFNSAVTAVEIYFDWAEK